MMSFQTDHERAADILLVEDNPADVALMEEVLQSCAADFHLHVAMDGDDAIAFLRHKGSHAESPRPDLILLDLNLPGCDGHDVLATVKSDAALRQIPTVILTSSPSEDDVVRCYDNHANAYMNKAHDFDGFVRLAQAISDYWLMSVRLPPR